MSLLVPGGMQQNGVKRYEVVNGGVLYPPLETDVGWWVCVDKGRIIEQPEEGWTDSYGKIVVTHIVSDKTNGEKGME